MSTTVTRIGGIEFMVTHDDGRFLGHFINPPSGMVAVVYLGTRPEEQRRMYADALNTVLHWQDQHIEAGQTHVTEHAVSKIDAMLFGVLDDGVDLRQCRDCVYWTNVLKQRFLAADVSHGVTPLPEVGAPDPEQRIALFHKGRRIANWTEEAPVQRPDGTWQRQAHVEVFAPWGEVLCATAPLDEIVVHAWKTAG